MSLVRLVYYSMMIGGWAGLAGWLVFELLFSRSAARDSMMLAVMAMAIVGAAIGVGINIVAGLANGQWQRLAMRVLPGLVCGALGGAVGGLVGSVLYSAGTWFLGLFSAKATLLTGVLRACGWLIAGLGIGAVDGLYERSASKIRNGLIGGGIGGLVGGVLFEMIQQSIRANSDRPGLAAGFVVLGMCIGALVGLAQMVLKEAWLTVLDGWRAGRQLILSQPVTILGRGDHLPLPFLGHLNRDIESEHLKIIRHASGQFVLEDNHSRLGTRLNSQPVQGPTPLKDGDVIKFGTNFVRFNERHKKAGQPELVISQAPFAGQIAGAPPPPKVRTPAAPTPAAGAAAPAVPAPRPVAPQPAPSPAASPSPKPNIPAPRPGGIAPPPPPRRPGAR